MWKKISEEQQSDVVGNTKQNSMIAEIQTFEVFTEKFSRIVQAIDLVNAIMKFRSEYPEDPIICIQLADLKQTPEDEQDKKLAKELESDKELTAIMEDINKVEPLPATDEVKEIQDWIRSEIDKNCSKPYCVGMENLDLAPIFADGFETGATAYDQHFGQRYRAEIERLKAENLEVMKNHNKQSIEIAEMYAGLDDAKNEISRLKKENEELKKHI